MKKKPTVKVKVEGYGKLTHGVSDLEKRVKQLETIVILLLGDMADRRLMMKGDENGETKKDHGASPPISRKRKRSG